MSRFRALPLLLLGLIVSLSGCYVNLAHQLDKDVRVHIKCDVPITKSGFEKYLMYTDDAEMKELLIQSLKSSLKSQSKHDVLFTDQNPDIEITISEISFLESTEKVKVDAPNSSEHGKSFDARQLDLRIEGTMVHSADNSQEKWYSNDNIKEQLVSEGGYHVETLPTNCSDNLINQVVTRASIPIFKFICRKMNDD